MDCEKLNDPSITAFSNKMDCFLDLDTAVVAARLHKKQLLVLFNSLACVECRRFELHLTNDHELSKLIKEKYILANLYVDLYCPLKKPLLANAPHRTKLKTLGNLNGYYQYRYTRMGQNIVLMLLNQDAITANVYSDNLFDSQELARFLLQQ
jgi:thiol:disulfide interchange protein DsbD